MKTSELRIGNLFIEGYTGKILEVRGLTKKNITFSGFFKGDWRAEPIGITSEWLNKLGFTNDSISLNTPDKSLIMSAKSKSKCYFYVEDIFAGSFDFDYIEYVHQLQNLYYTLTGKELTIKR